MTNLVVEKVAKMVADEAIEKTFSSGSTGFYAGGKVTVGEARYQVSCSIVLVGSKPKP